MLLRVVVRVMTFILLEVATISSETTNGYSYASNPLTLTTLASHTNGNGVPNKNATSTTIPYTANNYSVTTEALYPHQSGDLCFGNCDGLPAPCYDCNTTNNCTYGSDVSFQCTVKSDYKCIGQRRVERIFKCTYCFLLQENIDYTCNLNYTNCRVNAAPPQKFNATCTVNADIFCLGKRTFVKSAPCNWTSGYKWYIALALSITLGGFGADRFYLGYWKEALGKLFSFGGLGVWTLIDIVLIGTSYLTPADGSLYIS